MNELVTICVATYNRKDKLMGTLKSILNQTYRNIQIIIVDDCSTDGTRNYIEENILKIDRRILYIKHDCNKGLASARNTAINNANGKYFTFCDDDDRWEVDFIAEFVDLAKDYNSDWCFFCGGKYTNLLGTVVNTTKNVECSLRNYIKLGFTPPVASQFYFLESLIKIRGYNEEIKSGVDHDLWFRLAKINTQIKSLPIPLSIQNSGINVDRITTNYSNRINGIKRSLVIWEKDLVLMYGVEFYEKYSLAYLEREKYFLFNLYLTELQLRQAFFIINEIPISKSLRIILRVSIKIFIKNISPKFILPKEYNLIMMPTIKILQ